SYLTTFSDGLARCGALLPVGASDGGGGGCGGGGASASEKIIPCPVARALVARTAATGTDTESGAAPQRARNVTKSFPRFRPLVAMWLTFRMILPPCTYCWGTSTPGTDASTTRCGVCRLSVIHSCIARNR